MRDLHRNQLEYEGVMVQLVLHRHAASHVCVLKVNGHVYTACSLSPSQAHSLPAVRDSWPADGLTRQDTAVQTPKTCHQIATPTAHRISETRAQVCNLCSLEQPVSPVRVRSVPERLTFSLLIVCWTALMYKQLHHLHVDVEPDKLVSV